MPFDGVAGTYVELLNWAAGRKVVHPRPQKGPETPPPFPYLPSTPQEVPLAYLEVVGLQPGDCPGTKVTVDDRPLPGEPSVLPAFASDDAECRPRSAGGVCGYSLGGAIATRDDDLLAALRQHWAASDANDFDSEHRIYRDDAILEYPQSGERIRGRQNIQASRVAQPNAKRFTLRRIVGGGNVWISELVLTYDGHPSYVVSIMEVEDGKVVRETQYFGEAFDPGLSRVQWVERMGSDF